MKNKIVSVFIVMLAIALTIGVALAASTPNEEAPVITSTPITTAQVNQQYSYQVQNTPADNGSVVYSLQGATHGATISETGLMTWTPDASGNYNFSVRVADNDSFDEQNFTVTVASTPPQFSAGDVELGSSSQKRDENIVGQAWTVTNTGSEPITGISLNIIGVSSEYNLQATLPTTTLQGGQSMDILFNLYVPLDQDSGNQQIGSIQLTSSNAGTLTKNINLETENNLIIKKIKAKVGGSSDTLTSPGTIDREADYEDDVKLTVEVENTFSDNIRIEDININLDAPDLDPADGLDDSINRLDDGDTDEVIFTWTMSLEDVDAQDAPFTITVSVDGQDENGATHGEEWDIKLDMNSKSRDLRIVSVTPVPSVLSCDDKSMKVDYTLRNVGTRDTDNAIVKFEIPDISYGTYIIYISLDSGEEDDYSSILAFNKKLDEGTYFLEMTVYATDSTSDDTDSKTYSFQVNCTTSNNNNNNGSTTTQNNNSGINVNQGNVPVQVTGVPVSSSTGSNVLGNTDTYLIVLGVLVIVLLVVVVALATRLAGNKR